MSEQLTAWVVSANGHEFGIYHADTAQQARDLCAQDAGYKSESEMVEGLEQPSELEARPA
jgi:hypothetical protein